MSMSRNKINLFNIIRGFLGGCFFNPQRFWEKFNQDFMADTWQHRIFPQHYWLEKTIKKLKPKNILEVGCGFGRNLKFLIDRGVASKKLTGVDFSKNLLGKAKVFLKNDKIILKLADAKNLPFKEGEFDLVFTHGLLMHVPPKQVKRALGEIVRVSKKWLILIEETREKPGKINYFTFIHDYEGLIKEFGLKIVEETHDVLNLVWYLLKK